MFSNLREELYIKYDLCVPVYKLKQGIWPINIRIREV